MKICKLLLVVMFFCGAISAQPIDKRYLPAGEPEYLCLKYSMSVLSPSEYNNSIVRDDSVYMVIRSTISVPTEYSVELKDERLNRLIHERINEHVIGHLSYHIESKGNKLVIPPVWISSVEFGYVVPIVNERKNNPLLDFIDSIRLLIDPYYLEGIFLFVFESEGESYFGVFNIAFDIVPISYETMNFDYYIKNVQIKKVEDAKGLTIDEKGTIRELTSANERSLADTILKGIDIN